MYLSKRFLWRFVSIFFYRYKINCKVELLNDIILNNYKVPVITTTPIAIQCSPCSINLCQNGGKCIDNNCLGTCQCGFSYYGEFCQYPIIIAPSNKTQIKMNILRFIQLLIF